MVQVEPVCLMFVVHVVNNCKTKHRYLDIWDAALSWHYLGHAFYEVYRSSSDCGSVTEW